VDAETRARRAASFDAVAEAYERARPGYPDDAVRWLVGEPPLDVLDLGAGTGKLTRSLVALGHRVTAVEPLPAMRGQLVRAVPGATALDGTAERIPAVAASFDVVTVAQAFHWFDHERALPEIARVLRPGGALALVWNMRDESVPWVAELGTLMRGGTFGTRIAETTIPASGLFEPLERASFAHAQLVDEAALRDLVLSRSDCAVAPGDVRADVLGRLSGLFAAHAVDGVLALPYATECYRAVPL
jgi:ubiquinone/menaquinone biosynthesis C-methylase UbiE